MAICVHLGEARASALGSWGPCHPAALSYGEAHLAWRMTVALDSFNCTVTHRSPVLTLWPAYLFLPLRLAM